MTEFPSLFLVEAIYKLAALIIAFVLYFPTKLLIAKFCPWLYSLFHEFLIDLLLVSCFFSIGMVIATLFSDLLYPLF